ncbi:autorepressor SdpR family transcription factor [Bacillus haynesii]|uniref:autorepressor SdpR family transcription factor n=1 Tax=Bacillus haynesii TaxID=1925021 RepID=UPI00227E80B0|nr:autorepressor SdpR family transcription factor [Bacillus haynesii]MCY7817876.1 autorepressor SdpR family transcription factor [Bacillus haynesii]MCY8223957.1 autorepressor SdpR family transcription factor [Bacillus haynesii]MCY8243566.1 autorepressor SdpR family transcription factor [Bacillus haynesii]MCY8568630.1 autorepressor SdpR family transcription factor [Bacillus haynesii]MCY8664590.1 autorepressor SdpR family transcription factor [Bacillus haynesii]
MNQTFKALADPTRRKILNLLKDRDMTAGEISDQFQMSKPSISQHLKILKQAELIQDEKKGQYIIYSLNTTMFQEIIGWAFSFTEQAAKDKGDAK